MKRIEDLEREYQDFKVKSDFIKNPDDLKTLLEVATDDLDAELVAFYDELRESCRSTIGAKIINFVTLLAQDEVEYYEEDMEYLDQQINLTKYFFNLYLNMISVSNEENCQELVKLYDFAAQYYIKQIDYYDYSRDQLESLLRGIQLYNSKYEDNDEVIRKFFDLKMSKYEIGKPSPTNQYRK